VRPLSDARRAEILQVNEGLAREGLRTLGVAYRPLDAAEFDADDADDSIEQELVFAGLIGMIDPPRAEAIEAVARAKAGRHPPADAHRRSSRNRRGNRGGARYRGERGAQ